MGAVLIFYLSLVTYNEQRKVGEHSPANKQVEYHPEIEAEIIYVHVEVFNDAIAFQKAEGRVGVTGDI
jgi:hypothetical protein